MKDKNNAEVEIGDYLKDHLNDLSKVVSFHEDGKDNAFVTFPIINSSGTLPDDDGLWYIRFIYAEKIPEEEALLYILKGSCERS